MAIEPFHDNIIRLHKAAKLENIDSKITLITNAISNIRNDAKLLNEQSENIGGQSLLIYDYKKNLNKSSNRYNNKYLVETILLGEFLLLMNSKKNHKSDIILGL